MVPMKERGEGHFQISLMNVFRNAARERDARKTDAQMTEEGRVLSLRSLERREGAGQATLRNHLAIDLSGLLGTINLEAAQDLQGLDHVRNSILNYGMADLSRFTLDDLRRHKLANDLKAALLAHEPRLVADTLVVKLKGGNSTNQHIAFDITAEMAAKPVDVPLEFVAEIDTSAGKVALSNLMVRG
jgi:type VI secretion system protein ImpF